MAKDLVMEQKVCECGKDAVYRVLPLGRRSADLNTRVFSCKQHLNQTMQELDEMNAIVRKL